MRIDHSNQPPAGSSARSGAAETAAVKTATSPGSAGPPGHASADAVQLSGIAGILHASSSIRASQVSQLTQRVRGGDYHVPPSSISRSLVSETLAGSAHGRAR